MRCDINRITVEFKVYFHCDFSLDDCILIESQWNLKHCGVKAKDFPIDINRITVEFKDCNCCCNRNNGNYINRITVEFKGWMTTEHSWERKY